MVEEYFHPVSDFANLTWTYLSMDTHTNTELLMTSFVQNLDFFFDYPAIEHASFLSLTVGMNDWIYE